MAIGYRRFASVADLNCGCTMPLTSLRSPFQKNVDDRRFRGLARALDGMMDCAAFSLEAMENGEKRERISAKLDILAKDLAANRARQLLLEYQMSFLTRIRSGLPRLPRSHRT